MPVQHSPPETQTRSQARAQSFLTPTPRAPLDGTPEVPQLGAHLDRGPNLEGEALSRKEEGQEDQENSVEEEDSDVTGGVPSPVGASQGTGAPTPSHSNQPVSHKFEPSLLAVMQQMTPIMSNIQAASSSEESRPPAFTTPSMKAPEGFYWTQTFKFRSFIQSCQPIFHNCLANFSQDRKKVLYAISFLVGRASKWIQPCLFSLANQYQN
ncbi:hypothetical protein O181_053441 [Austropuccinia psidii MF-1]|uniref:DUF4939 domain-containing protein n=1 Tax=Austropuccinia psidii MF-1 TaxID=1389203 RepID=A0A9Q3E7H7_9BASI|nr:hypothetical protein [Austropuccinia psidii MF-1]